MKEPIKRIVSGRSPGAAALLAIWLAGAVGILAAGNSRATENDPAARFRGPLTYDFSVTNVKWEAVNADFTEVTFDLYWSFSWHAKWVEPAATSATGKDLEVENWDAAWVFVKFLAEPDKPRNYWRHASLAGDAAQNTMPTGATHTVRLSDDGTRGMGVFIYRNAIGHGVNDWKGIKLRWMHGADKVDVAKAEVKVHAIPMVYVPEGPFKVGAAGKSGLAPFADGPDVPVTRYDGEQSLLGIPNGLRKAIASGGSQDGGPYLQWDEHPKWSALTDGAWRGGPTIPFLVDAEWNAPAAEGTRGRQVGPVAGQIWSTHIFSERGGPSSGGFGNGLGGNQPLNDEYPTGYEAFYCMKYDLTQGQYVDFLNSLPPDVAAGRAFVSTEVSSDAGMRIDTVKIDRGPDLTPLTIREVAGHTIRSSADKENLEIPALPGAIGSASETGSAAVKDLEITEPNPESEALAGALLGVVAAKEKQRALEAAKTNKTAAARPKDAPVYSARCPFRRIPGVTGADSYAYAVWAGLRPMSALENAKAGAGARNTAIPADWAPPKDYEGPLVLLDAGLPTERFASGRSQYGNNMATRVGCRSTPTSDRGTACATYWGISELEGPAVGLAGRPFRASHGNGVMPAGIPDASFARFIGPFKDTPPDWPSLGAYIGGHFVGGNCRLVASAANRPKKPAPGAAQVPAPRAVAQSGRRPERIDNIKVSNVKCEPGGKDFSTISFDVAWDRSWRAAWTEPADRNVSGQALKVESWDAAWVFVKFRRPDAAAFSPATLAPATADHRLPAGAGGAVGLCNENRRGIGIFIYRNAVGQGSNNFQNVSLRWLNGADKADPAGVRIAVHALPMVYVSEGAFASRSPWGHALKIIQTPDATQPGGHLDSGPETLPRHATWPNGYRAFYCMKYSITQGQYAEMLNSVALPGAPWYNGRYSVLAHNNIRRHSDGLYGFDGYSIRFVAGEFRYEVDAPDRVNKLLSIADIGSYLSWAGLRFPSNLEYEKACRGPRAVAQGGDAWTPATCAPADGLDKSILTGGSAVGPGPSYWGIRQLSLSGCIQEWPVVLQNEPAGKDAKEGCCAGMKGLHGEGSPEPPEEFPWTAFGDWYYGGIWRMWGYGTVAQWIEVSALTQAPWEAMDGSRCGRYGARGVRTAPGPLEAQTPPRGKATGK